MLVKENNIFSQIIDSYINVFNLIIHKINFFNRNNTLENLNAFVKESFEENFTTIFIKAKTLYLFEKNCFKFFGKEKKNFSFFKKSSLEISKKYFVKNEEKNLSFRIEKSGKENEAEENNQNLHKENISIQEKIDNNNKKKNKLFKEKFDFIQNSEIKKKINLLFDEKKQTEDNNKTKFGFNLDPTLREEKNKLKNKNTKFIYCSLCELIIPSSLIFDVDKKTRKLIKVKGWPCFGENLKIHNFNSAESVSCEYISNENKQCKKFIDSYHFDLQSVFKKIHLYEFFKKDMFQKILSLDFLIEHLRSDVCFDDFISMIYFCDDTKVTDIFITKNQKNLEEVKIELNFLSSFLQENREIQSNTYIKILFYKLKKVF